ncbi:hypothetical protein NLU13_8232 [Sarocladium strictum]|uniref:Fungal N-terminal domain-containing protein n=1 Tax=Sarocladium strictum TaxID=5046 RepID=A0AA39GB97_SARSR|nr:hypothetical protein NLU13_8232 [Sarocladium strictum]
MDPLSITASAITLIAAAGSIATTVNTFARALRTADTRLIDLTTELSHLTDFLKAVQSALKGHRSYDLSHFDDCLWQQSEITLSTCQTTLNELNVLVTEIRQGAGKAILGRRARLAATLTTKAAELQGFRDRIAKSNLALQTILQTITVALSLRNNASQTLILRGLEDLQASIDSAISRSWQNNRVGSRLHASPIHSHANAQLNRNLRDLAHAAKQFHSAASSTASSAANSARSDDDGSSAPWQSYAGAAVSLFGDFSDDLRERVEEYVREAPAAPDVEEPRKRRKTLSFPAATLPGRALATMVEEEDEADEHGNETDEEDEVEFELAFVKGLQELISHHIRAGHYTKAIGFINEAMSNSAVTSCDGLLRTLQSQLALVHLLQGQWRSASSVLISTLARAKKDRDAVVCSLLHGLAIACLTEYAFDDALSACKMALYGRRRLQKRGELSVNTVNRSIGLFATIYDMTGDYVRAEVLRGQLPNDFIYTHPRNIKTFLLEEEVLKDLLQGEMKVFEENNVSVVPGVFELADRAENVVPGLGRRGTTSSLMSPLRTRICEHERLEHDTTKEVVVVEPGSPDDADDEASPVAMDEESPVIAPLRRRLTQMFRTSGLRRPVAVKPVPEADDEANDSGYCTSSPVENGTPTSPWRLKDFSPLKRTKTKKLLKKQPARKEKVAFRVLNMESKAKVEAPRQSAETSRDSPAAEDEPWKPEWIASAQLAELDAPMEKSDSEERRVLGQADQPRQETSGPSLRMLGSSNSATIANMPNDLGGLTNASSEEEKSTRMARYIRLEIPRASDSPNGPPLSVPSLDPRNLIQETLSPRLGEAFSSLAQCLTRIPDLKTPDEMDGTRIHLCFLLAELHACGSDKMVKADVEAAVARLWRRSARLRRRAEREKEKKTQEQREKKKISKSVSALASIEEGAEAVPSPFHSPVKSTPPSAAAATSAIPLGSRRGNVPPRISLKETRFGQDAKCQVPGSLPKDTSTTALDDVRHDLNDDKLETDQLDDRPKRMLRPKLSFESQVREVLEVGTS